MIKTALVSFALVGCCARLPPKLERVEVPVSVPCRPPAIERPALATDSLPIDALIWDQMRALRAERLQLRGHVARLEAGIEGCR